MKEKIQESNLHHKDENITDEKNVKEIKEKNLEEFSFFKKRKYIKMAFIYSMFLLSFSPTSLDAQRYPKELKNKDTISQEIKWNKTTEEKINFYSQEYIKDFRKKNPNSNLADKNLQEKFLNFLKTFASKIQVITPEKENFNQKLINKKIYQINPNIQAMYRSNHIFYMNEKYDNLNNFLAELSHHINKDTKFSRLFFVFQDLLKNKNSDLYNKYGSFEHQAHEFSEKVIFEFLYDEKLKSNTDFLNLYNKKIKEYKQED